MGGGPTVTELKDAPQELLIPLRTIECPVVKVSILNNLPTTTAWEPAHKLQYREPTHLLDLAIPMTTKEKIKLYCQHHKDAVIIHSKQKPHIVVTTQDLRNLVSHGKSINDETIYLFLEIFCSSCDLTFLSEKFFTLLKRNGWQQVRRYFAQNLTSKGRSTTKPCITGEQAIAIPCFIHGCHWIAVVRREIQGRVFFLFSDDMNNSETEKEIKQVLSTTTDENFYPTTATWIHCKAPTYIPHSNECGPRSLLAISIMMLHPNPHHLMLMAYMNPNIAQISRIWVAATLISGTPHSLPMITTSPSLEAVKSAVSQPYSTITWSINNITNCVARPPSQTNYDLNSTTNKRNASHTNISTTTLVDSHHNIPLGWNTSQSTAPQRKTPEYAKQTKNKPKDGVLFHSLSNQKRTTQTRTSTTQQEKHKSFITDYISQHSSNPHFLEAEQTWGHALEQIETSTILRVLLQNPNGLKPSHQDELFLNLQTCSSIGTGILCLPETNTNWSNYTNTQTLRQSLKSVWSHSTFQTSNSSEKFESDYQPGGTVTMVVNRWTSRVVDKGSDPFGLGRWTYITLRGKGDKKLTVVTGYRVCKTTVASAGVKTAFMQQYRALSTKLRETGKTSKPNPRRQFVLDLQAWLEHLVTEGHQIILSIDSNDDLNTTAGNYINLTYDPTKVTVNSTHDGSLSTLLNTCGLIDILQKHHTGNAPATYNRGTTRLDYILVSSSLAPTVLRSGILPFYSVFLSDHRPCYIDLDALSLFNDSTPQIAPADRRGLQLTDPRKVQNYLEVAKHQIQYHKIVEKKNYLQETATNGLWGYSDIDEYEKIDQLQSEIYIHAERSITKKYSKKYDWSPTLARAINTVRFWRLKLKRSKGQIVSDSTLSATANKASVPEHFHGITTRHEIIEQLRLAIRDRANKKAKHSDLRQNYLLDLAEALVLKNNPSLADPLQEPKLMKKIANQIKALAKKEKRMRMFNKIGHTLSPPHENMRGLLRIDVPASTPLEPYPIGPDPKTWEGPWCSITDPKLIAKFICATNTRQYNQAESTPFGSGYLKECIGLEASSLHAHEILQGTFIPDPSITTLPETKDIITQLGQPLLSTPAPFKNTISAAEFTATYKVVSEKTTSSPSGRHVGHYKAAARDPILSDLHSGMMSIPFQAGFSPKRWRQVTDIMLEKIPGEPKIHKLRIIALFESDYNQANRILFARQLGHHMEDTNLISSVQYGSRPGKHCISAVLNKQLTYDITRQTKCTAAFIENDAIGCYDRLINPLLLLQLKRLGAPTTATASLSKTWSLTCHNIKTTYGLSKQSYCNTEMTPLFGPGQGSTLGPFLWLLLFCLIIDAMGEVPVMEFTSVNNDIQLINLGEAFVDDSFLGCTSSYIEQPNLSFKQNQENHKISAITNLATLGQRWERLLFTTGGALNLHKSCWTLMAWKWQNGEAYLEPTANSSSQLLLTAGHNLSDPIPVPLLSPLDSYRTLGVYISPSGSTKKAYNILSSYSLNYASAITSSSLNKEEAYLSYMTFFLPKIRFPLPALTLTEQQCAKIQSPALNALLPKLHFNRHTARSIIHGPIKFGGVNLPHVYTYQCIGQLELFLGHIRSQDKTSELIMISISNLQLIVGSSTSFFNLPFPQYAKWVIPGWLTSLWKFLHRVNFSLQIKRQWTPIPQRENDIMLMDFFLSLKYKPHDLKILNQCRIYLQVFSLTDITSADGKQILPHSKAGQLGQDRKSSLTWPTQQRPTKKAWNLWQQALQHLETLGYLSTPLGKWTTSPHQIWHWFLDPISSNLYKIGENDQWLICKPLVRSNTRSTRSQRKPIYQTNRITVTSQPAEGILPASVQNDPITALATASSSSSTFPSASTPTLAIYNLYQYLTLQPFYERLLGPISMSLEEENNSISQAIAQNSLLLSTDGSFDPATSTGAHGWVIATEETILWQGAGPADGHAKLMSPYRAELSGIVAGLHILQCTIKFNSITRGTAILYSDCEKAINTITHKTYKGIIDYLIPDNDLVQEAKEIINSIPIKVSLQWVKGHYSGKEPSRAHTLNKQANDLAKAYLKHPHHRFIPSAKVTTPPKEKVSIKFENSNITSHLPSLICHQLHAEPLIKTICKEAKWDREIFNSVDWEAFGAAFSAMPRGTQMSYSKLTHGIINTNMQNFRFYGTSELCPCCLEHKETITHMFTCLEAPVTAHRLVAQQELWSKLRDLGTHNSLVENLIHGMEQWAAPNGGDPITTRALTSGSVLPLDVALVNAFRSQCKIGWEHFHRGRISTQWRKAFQLTQRDSTTNNLTPKKWAEKLISLILHYSLSLWKFRNGVLHGHTVTEEATKKRNTLQTSITDAYAAYEADKFIESRDLSTLFDKPLQYTLKTDNDFLQCWLNTFNEGIKTQQDFRRRQSEAAKNFFLPRRKLPVTQPTQNVFEQLPQTSESPTSSDSVLSDSSIASTISYSIDTSSFHFQTSSDEDYETDSLSVSGSTSVSDSLQPLHHQELSEDDSSSDSVFLPVFS
jgi:ribonuclease HI